MKKSITILVVIMALLSIMACQFSISPRVIQAEPSATSVVYTPAPTATRDFPLVEDPVPTLSPLESTLDVDQERLASLYERVNPGVVSIQVATDQGNAQGSGFVFDGLGHIVTNYHVVEGGTEFEVDFPSGYKVRGEVVAFDLDSDLAVIRVEVPAEELNPLPLGDSSQLRVGESVVAIGNPFGLDSTITLGIVSAKGRTLTSLRESPEGGLFSAGDLIQTDAAINPGNSGGPLLNLRGEVVGVNRAIQTNSVFENGNMGVGFAVSVDIVKRVVPVLIADGVYDYPYLGISSRDDLSLNEIEELSLPNRSGAYVVSVVPGSPADDAGMRGGTIETDIPGLNAGGDLIIAIDDRPVRVFGELLSYLMTEKSPGETVKLTIIRDNEQKEVEITLDKRP
ncbi:MAG: trypsin-like peptidase domain-containing protein [Anaerolineaceae bacterium]|nr:trypsin-like peptidase domain-containing protein [Anaerolineaceae bacterium]